MCGLVFGWTVDHEEQMDFSLISSFCRRRDLVCWGFSFGFKCMLCACVGLCFNFGCSLEFRCEFRFGICRLE